VCLQLDIVLVTFLRHVLATCRLSLRPLAEVQTLAWLIGVAFLAAWVRRLVS
jgi:hypothetical protein